MVKKIDTIEDKILGEFGKKILINGQSIVDSKSIIIPVSPKIDLSLGGGIPEGSFVIISGPPKAGKTITCLDFAATAQRIEYACSIGRKEGRHVYYDNVEGRIKSRDFVGIKHLDPKRLTVIESVPGKILTGEDHISIMERLINDRPGDIFIIDSFSALCTAGEMTANIGDRYRADAPVLLAHFCRRISNVVPINKSIVMGVTHIIANQGGGVSKWTEASGRKIQYQTDVKLKATHFVPWKSGETQIGQEIHWRCETSALGPPGIKSISKFRYGHGLDKEAEVLDLAVDLGIITKSGSWYILPNDEKFQGLDKTAEALRENPTLFIDLNKQTREMMGIV